MLTVVINVLDLLLQIPVGPHRLPYSYELGDRPSVEDLKDFVVYNKGRPHLQDAWKKHKVNNVLQSVLSPPRIN